LEREVDEESTVKTAVESRDFTNNPSP